MYESELPHVYIPSKCRLGCKTAELLESASVPFTVVVEPQEQSAYKKRWPVLVLPENNQGISYVRNWILKTHPSGWFWMLDDDISQFYIKGTTALIKADARSALVGAGKFFLHRPYVGQAALEYKVFSFLAKPTKLLVWNSYCDVAVCVNKDQVKMLKYRKEANLKEDRDFTLQILASGLKTMRVALYSFGCPSIGSNPGGLRPVYQTDGSEHKAILKMEELWPGVCRRIVKPNGKEDVKINWKHFTK